MAVNEKVKATQLSHSTAFRETLYILKRYSAYYSGKVKKFYN